MPEPEPRRRVWRLIAVVALAWALGAATIFFLGLGS